jgi:hypothetical protein
MPSRIFASSLWHHSEARQRRGGSKIPAPLKPPPPPSPRRRRLRQPPAHRTVTRRVGGRPWNSRRFSTVCMWAPAGHGGRGANQALEALLPPAGAARAPAGRRRRSSALGGCAWSGSLEWRSPLRLLLCARLKDWRAANAAAHRPLPAPSSVPGPGPLPRPPGFAAPHAPCSAIPSGPSARLRGLESSCWGTADTPPACVNARRGAAVRQRGSCAVSQLQQGVGQTGQAHGTGANASTHGQAPVNLPPPRPMPPATRPPPSLAQTSATLMNGRPLTVPTSTGRGAAGSSASRSAASGSCGRARRPQPPAAHQCARPGARSFG